MRKKFAEEKGFGRGLLLLLILIVIVGGLYLSRSRNVDVSETGRSVAVDVERAAEAIRETSEDAILTTKVKTALSLSKSASVFDIDVDSDEGVVTLTGALPSAEDKATVLQLARDTDGVASVVDRIQVGTDAAAPADERVAERLSDLEVESAVYQRLLASEEVDAKRIRVSVEGGVVRLTGSVPDSIQKERVHALVQTVSGVGDVVNDLDVLQPAARVERPL